MTDEEFLVLVERFLDGTLVPAERQALTQAVLSDTRLRTMFTEQARGGLELAAFLKPEGDAARRAEILLSVDSETRELQVVRTIEERLGVRLSREGGRKSTRILKRPTARQLPPMPRSAYWKAGAAAAGFAASLLALLLASRSGTVERPSVAAKDPRGVPAGPAEVEPRKESPESAKGVKPEPAPAVQPPEVTRPIAPSAEASKKVTEKPAAPAPGPVRVERLHGQAFILGIVKKVPARAGTALMTDQGLEVAGQGSRAALRLPEGTRLDLDEDTTLARISGPRPAGVGGRRVEVTRGVLVAEVAPEAPLSIGTPGAEIRIPNGTVRVVLDAGATRVEVRQGRAGLTRASDPRTVDVGPGQVAVAAAGEDPSPRAYREIVLPVTACAVEAGTADAPAPAVPPPAPTFALLLKWDLSAVPAGSRVLSVGVLLHATEKVSRPAEAFELKRPWADAQTPFFARTGGGVASPVGVKVLAVLEPGREREHLLPLSVDGVALIQNWVDAPAANHGLAVMGLPKPDLILADAPDARRAGWRPRLQITYVPK